MEINITIVKELLYFFPPPPAPSFFLLFPALNTHYTHAPNCLLPALHPIWFHTLVSSPVNSQVLDSAVVFPLSRLPHPAVSVTSPVSPWPLGQHMVWPYPSPVPPDLNTPGRETPSSQSTEPQGYSALPSLRLLGAISYSRFNPARGCFDLLWGFLLMPGPVHQRT